MFLKLSLSRKIQLLILSIVTVFFISTLLLKMVINKETYKLLQSKLKDTKQVEVPKLLSLHDAFVKNYLLDYTSWDQSVDFVDGKLPKEWADEEYASSLENYNVNYIWAYNAKGKLVYSNGVGFGEVLETRFIDSLKNNTYKKWYKKVDGRLIEVFGSSITKLSDENNKKNAKGFLLIGREVNELYINDLKSIFSEMSMHLHTQISDSSNNLKDKIEAGNFSFSYPLMGFNNQPVAYLKIVKDFNVVNNYKKILSNFLLGFTLFFSLIGILFYIASKKIILTPFSYLTKSLSYQKPELLYSLRYKKDEFKDLSNLMLQFFSQKEKLEKEINIRKQSELDLLNVLELNKYAEAEKQKLEEFIKDQNQVIQLNANANNQNYNDSLKEIIELTAKAINCEKVGIWLFNEERKSIDSTHCFFLSTNSFSTEKEEALEVEYPNYFKHLKQNTSIIANDAQNNLATSELTNDYYLVNNITSIIDIPIRSDNKVIGVLCCEHVGSKRDWTNSEQLFVSSIANFIALQMEKEERKKAEALLIENQHRFEEAQELAKVGSWEFNFITGEVKWSKEMYRIIEVEQVEGQNLMDIFYSKIHKEDRDILTKVVEQLVTNGARNYVECRVIANDGSIKYINAIGDILLSKKNKKAIGIKGSLQDITKTKLADKAKSDFLSTMSHEIRTPINGVIGIANLLLDEELNERQREYVNTLNYSAKHLASVVSDILDFSKIESNAMTFEKISFNLKENCKHIFDLFQSKAEENGTKYTYSPTEVSEYSLYGDPVRLNQILSNLVSNAIKFTKKGSVDFSYTIAEETNHDLKVQFKIVDTGIGISKESQKYIFDSFRQANEKVTRTFGGTGLGLTICKKLVELQNGTISVESHLGKGTTFTVELRFEKHLYKSNKLRKDEILEPVDKSILKDLKVLVAEDNKINAMVLGRFLDKWGVEYKVAKNGMEVLNNIKEDTYDLILMDIQMPIMDGIEATKLIRSLPNEKLKNITIVAFTADASVDTHKSLLKNGFSHCMTKPFDPDMLFKYFCRVKKMNDESAEPTEFLQAVSKDKATNA